MPASSDNRISLVRVKVERAKKHVLDLERELITCRYDSMYVALADLQSYVGKFRQGIPAPSSLTLRPFDVLPGNTPTSQTGFPIAKDWDTYESIKKRKVEGIRPEPQ